MTDRIVANRELSAGRSHLLDREIPPQYLAESTGHIAKERTETVRATKATFVFRIEQEWMALPPTMLQEVMDDYTIHTIPGCSREIVRGLVKVRGELLLCLSLNLVLGLQGTGAKGNQDRLLVFSQGRFAVQVSEVFGIYRHDLNDLRSPSATLRNSAGGAYTIGLFDWEGRTVSCLDGTLVLYAINKGLA